MIDYILEILPQVITIIVTFAGGGFLMNKYQKKHAHLENEAFEGEEWKKLYEAAIAQITTIKEDCDKQLTERKEEYDKVYAKLDEREKKLDERIIEWERRIEEKDRKIDMLYEEVTKHRDDKVALRNEKDVILHDLSELKLEVEQLEKMKCLVRNCRYRRPPSEYMGVDFSDVFMFENKSKEE